MGIALYEVGCVGGGARMGGTRARGWLGYGIINYSIPRVPRVEISPGIYIYILAKVKVVR